MKKRILATLLSLCLVVGLLPVTALAAGTVSVTTEAELLTAIEAATGTAENPTVIKVAGTIELTARLTIPANKHIKLTSGMPDLSDYDNNPVLRLSDDITKSDKESMVTLNTPGALTIEGVTLDANSKGRVIGINDGTYNLTVNEGAWLRNGYGNAAGIRSWPYSGTTTITLNGGKITDCSATKNSAAVQICCDSGNATGILTVNDITMTNCSGGYGDIVVYNTSDNSTVSAYLNGGSAPRVGVMTASKERNLNLYLGAFGACTITNQIGANYYLTAALQNEITMGISRADGTAVFEGALGYTITNEDAQKVILAGKTCYTENNQMKAAATVQVAFKSNGGSGDDYTQAVPSGIETALNKNTFTLTGYNFAGWKVDGADTTYDDADNVTLTDDTILLAQWTPKEYTITYNLNGGTAGENPPAKHTYATATALVNPTREGYTFGGWYKDAALTQSAGASLGATDYTNDIDLFAKWTKTVEDKTYFVSPIIDDQTYTGSAIVPAVAVKDGDGNIVDSNEYTVICSDESNVNAGTANIAVKMGEVEIGTASFTITPAPLTVTADNQSMYVNGTKPTFTFQVSGLLGNDQLTTEPTLTCSADGKTTGTYDIVPSGADAGANYTIRYVEGTLTVCARSSGGGSSSGSNTSTSTTTNKDGSTTTTTTNKTTGDVTETTKMPDGTTGTVVTDKNGDITQITASVSSAAAKESSKTGEAVTLPVEVPAVKATEDAPAVQITVPRSTGSVKVEIPVERVTPGTVAVIVSKDGTEKIAAASVTTEDGVVLTVSGTETVKVIDNSKRFTDVPADNVFYDEISALSAREIMVGRTDDKFDLYSSVTLNQIANVAGRITGAVDVSNFNAGVVWGAENGMKTGSVAATRGDVLKALYIAAGSPVVEDTSILARFKDAAGIPADLAAIAAWAARNGILKGDLNGNANLSANVTRGQACALAGRTMGTLA